ncbi:lectin-like [Megalops cyprinoides]|uniref:lectin-like n=1 Tax=Megalops cyprinoides TaxID=118141 RepID=UPI0018646567|nr:lectin-like [Megalops cyprinoides]
MKIAKDSGLSVRVKEHCYTQFPPVCDINKYADWYRVGSYCLKYFNTSLNFSDAEFFCRNAAPGGHLVSVHSEQANTDLLCIVMKHNASHPRIWMGGMELFQSNKFIWIDGSRWEYQNWVPGQPDNTRNKEDCVEMNWSRTGKWNDDTCSNKKTVVCSFKSRV